MALKGLQGLSADDREKWEKDNIKELKELDYYNSTPEDQDRIYKNLKFREAFSWRDDYKSKLINLSDNDRDIYYDAYTSDIEEGLKNLDVNKVLDKALDRNPVYENDIEDNKDSKSLTEYIQDFGEEYKDYNDMVDDFMAASNSSHRTFKNSISEIQKVAEESSPYYKKYKDSGLITLSDTEWDILSNKYKAAYEMYGKQAADERLNFAIKENVAQNQPWYEQAWNGLQGMGASAVGSMVTTAGMIKGTVDYLLDEGKKTEGLSDFENFIDNVIDNDWTRYGNDIVTYGSWRPEAIAKAKEIGLSDIEIVNTAEQEGSILNATTPWELIASGGFTTAAILMGAGEAKIVESLFKGLKYGTKATAKALNVGRKRYRNLLAGLQKAENKINAFALPALSGTSEGAVEGLSTKIQAEEDGMEELRNAMNEVWANNKEAIDADMVNEVSKYRESLPEEVRNSELPDEVMQEIQQKVFDKYFPGYAEAVKQVQFAASKAGILNFRDNSLINGIMAYTLKAGYQAPTVQKAIANSKKNITKKLGLNKSKYDIDFKNKTVKPKHSKAIDTAIGTAKGALKESSGEGLEESLQNISTEASTAWAANNIEQFLNNKFSGDGTAVIGDIFGTETEAYLNAAGEAVTDFQTIKSGVYGALSSALGMPGLKQHNKVQGKNGRKSSRFYLGRGIKENGEVESTFDMINRFQPFSWRSSIIESYQKTKREQEDAEKSAEALQIWLRDPKNKDKFDGGVGTLNWIIDMDNAAKSNDEFSYRNSRFGKTINDIFMLQEFEGTQFYKDIMDNLSDMATLEEGSPLASQVVKDMRSNVYTKDDSITDTQIIGNVRKNANRMLSMMDEVKTNGEVVDGLFGNLDKDTKQAFTFLLSREKDWTDRKNSLEEKINSVRSRIKSSSKSGNVSKEVKEIIARYGTIGEALKEKKALEEKIKKGEEAMKSFKSRTTTSKYEERAFAKLEKTIEESKQELKKLNALPENLSEEDLILNEDDIMSLNAEDRGQMLINGNRQLYETFHGSPEEIKDLENKIRILEYKVKNWKSKGRIKKGHNKQVINTEKEIANLKKQLAEKTSKTKSRYSEAQQTVIDNLLAQGRQLYKEGNFFEDVADLGKIESSLSALNEEYTNALIDSASITDIANKARINALKRLAQERGRAIEGIKDSKDFAFQLDKVFNESSSIEIREISDILKNSENEEVRENFEKYINNYKTREDLLNFASKFNIFEQVDRNDIDAFLLSMSYLQSKNIDIKDKDAVLEAFTEEDKDGNNLLEKYLDEFNSRLPKSQQFAFPSGEYYYHMYRDLIDKYEEYSKEVESNNSPIEVTGTTSKDNNPAVSPTPKSKEDLEKYKEREDLNNLIQETIDEFTKKGYPQNTIDYISKLLQVISTYNDGSITIKDRAEAVEYIKSLVDSDDLKNVDTEGDFISKFLDKMNEMQSQNRIVISRIISNSLLETFNIKKNEPTKDNPKGTSEHLPTRVVSTEEGSNSSSMDSIKIFSSKIEGREKPIIDFWEQYNIESYLKKHFDEEGFRKKPVYFTSNSTLNTAIKNEKGEDYNEADDLVVIAVVQDDEGGIIIKNDKGEDIHYQPIAIFPSSREISSSGINKIDKIRQYAKSQNNNGTSLIEGENGVLKGTFLTLNVPSENVYITDPESANNSIQDLERTTLNKGEIQVLDGDKLKQGNRTKSILEKMKNHFLSNVVYREEISTKQGDDYSGYVLKVPNLKHDNNTDESHLTEVPIWITKVSISKSLNSGKSIFDLLTEGSKELSEGKVGENISDLISANSRLSAVTKLLKSQIEKLNKSASFDFKEKDLDTGTVLTSLIGFNDSILTIEEIGNELKSKIGRSLSIDNSLDYKVIPAIENGEAVYKVVLYREGSAQPIKKELVTISKSKINNPDSLVFTFLRNLMMDGDKMALASDPTFEFVKWQVEYPNNTRSNEKHANESLSSAYDDNILEMSINSLIYPIELVTISAPFKSTDEEITDPKVVNPVNAEGSKPSNPIGGNIVTTPQGVNVDSDTGAPIDRPKLSEEQQKIQDTIDKIEDLLNTNTKIEKLLDARNNSEEYKEAVKKAIALYNKMATSIGLNKISEKDIEFNWLGSFYIKDKPFFYDEIMEAADKAAKRIETISTLGEIDAIFKNYKSLLEIQTNLSTLNNTKSELETDLRKYLNNDEIDSIYDDSLNDVLIKYKNKLNASTKKEETPTQPKGGQEEDKIILPNGWKRQKGAYSVKEGFIKSITKEYIQDTFSPLLFPKSDKKLKADSQTYDYIERVVNTVVSYLNEEITIDEFIKTISPWAPKTDFNEEFNNALKGSMPFINNNSSSQESASEFSIDEEKKFLENPSGVEGVDFATITVDFKGEPLELTLTVVGDRIYRWSSKDPLHSKEMHWKDVTDTYSNLIDEVKNKLNKSGQDNITPSRPPKVFVNEEETKLTEGQKKAKKVVDQILSDADKLQLKSDNSGYENSSTKAELARVTKIIAATEGGKEFREYEYDETEKDKIKRDSEGNPVPNKWILPSTNIGTGFDEMVRDFMGDKIIKTKEGWKTKDGSNLSSIYPNATEKALQAFANNLAIFKKEQEEKGLTFVTRDVTVTGTLRIKDKDGKSYTLDVAGTLDLLAYDRDGNFHIFDMKTRHSSLLAEATKDKYSRQLTLYKEFLEQKYGINVVSTKIIPIKVEYPTPNDATGVGGKATYTTKPGKGNQLFVNNRRFTGANPIRQELINITPQSLTFIIDKLDESEKALLKEDKSQVPIPLKEDEKPLITPDVENDVSEIAKERMIGRDSSVNDLLAKYKKPITPITGSPNKSEFGVSNGSLDWENLSETTKDYLESQNISEEEWKSYEQSVKENIVDCHP